MMTHTLITHRLKCFIWKKYNINQVNKLAINLKNSLNSRNHEDDHLSFI